MEYGSPLVTAILSGERRWGCYCCSVTFSAWQALADHLATVHGFSGTTAIDHDMGHLVDHDHWQTMIYHWLPQRQEEDTGI